MAYLDEPPFFSPVADGDPVGCDIELTNAVLARLGVERIEFVLATFGDLIAGVHAGRWHVNTPMFITADRSNLVDFSVPVWAALDGFIARRDDERNFSSYESIATDESIRVAVVTGQKQYDVARRVGVAARRITEFADQDSMVRGVLSETVDVLVSTAPGNHAYLARAADDRLRSFADAGADRDPIAVGAFSFAKSMTELSTAFNAALRDYLGTAEHLRMMERHGFSRDALAPVLAR